MNPVNNTIPVFNTYIINNILRTLKAKTRYRLEYIAVTGGGTDVTAYEPIKRSFYHPYYIVRTYYKMSLKFLPRAFNVLFTLNIIYTYDYTHVIFYRLALFAVYIMNYSKFSELKSLFDLQTKITTFLSRVIIVSSFSKK